MSSRTLVIVNPMSRNGATGRRWQRVEGKLRDALGPLEVASTRAPRDAERLAREGVRAGIERIVVAGGDGTLSEVASGLLSADLARYAELGLLPLGTGGDFTRSLGVPAHLDAAIACIAAGERRAVDAGVARFADATSGAPRSAWFVNVASFGISGLIVELVNRTTKRFGGRASFLAGTLRAIRRYRSEPVALRVDGVLVHEGPLLLATAASGRYFGGGMQVAPEAVIDDGALDVVVVQVMPVPRLLAKLPRIYAGTHLRDSAVASHRGRLVEAEAAGRVPLELDGEPLGVLPARIEVLPRALTLLAPPRAATEADR